MKKTSILITKKLFVFVTVFALLLNPFTVTFALEETSETNYLTNVETIEENKEESTYEDDSYPHKEELEEEVELKEEIVEKDSIVSKITQSIPEKASAIIVPTVSGVVALDDTPTPGLGSGPWLNLGDVTREGTFAYDNFWETAEDASEGGVYRITVNQINDETILYSINAFDDLEMTEKDMIFPTPHSNTWASDPTNSTNNFTNTNSQIVHHFPQDFTQVTNEAIEAGSPGELNVQYYSIMNNTNSIILVSYVGAVYGGYDNNGEVSAAFDEEQWSQWINTGDTSGTDFLSGVTLKPGQTMPIFLINWGLPIDADNTQENIHYNIVFTWNLEVLDTYTVSFDPGSQSTLWDVNDTTTTGLLLNETMPTPPTFTNPSGYTFAGWLIEGTTTIFTPSAPLPSSVTGNVTFVAQWEETTFTVAFDPGIAINPDTGVGLWVKADQTYTNLPNNSPMPTPPSTVLVNPDPNPDPSTHWRPGHVFAGWLQTDSNGNTFYPVTVGNTPDEVPDGTTIMPINTPIPTNVTEDVTFTAQWLPAVYVMFVLQVEGLLSYPHTHAVAIPVGTNVDDNNVDPDLNVWLDQYLSVYLGVDLWQQAFQDFPGWTGYSYIDGNQVSNSLTIESLLTDTDGIYVFEGSLTLQRFTVVFVDPLVNLYGQTIEVPFGSTIKEPSIHHPQYFLPEGLSSAGWFMNVFTDVNQATDAISNPTPNMPGNSINPIVNERIITLGVNADVRITPGGGLVGWHPTPAHPHEMEVLELDNNRVVELDTSNKEQFIFNGSEVTGPTDPANMTRVTANKIIVRLHQEEVEPTPDTPVAPRPTPRIPTTGGDFLTIALTSVVLGSLILVRKKFKDYH